MKTERPKMSARDKFGLILYNMVTYGGGVQYRQEIVLFRKFLIFIGEKRDFRLKIAIFPALHCRKPNFFTI